MHGDGASRAVQSLLRCRRRTADRAKGGAFTRHRDFPLNVLLFSLLADAARRFECGSGKLIQILGLLGCFPKRPRTVPTEEAYRQACAKLPVAWVREAAHETHRQARTTRDPLYEGLRVVLNDGTKVIIPRTEETVQAYGLGSGRTGSAYYPQIHMGAFFDLATATFADINIEHGTPAEREILLQHARQNREPTLYVADAGLNGMAQVFFMSQTGHHLLMELKMGDVAEPCRRSRRRSVLVTVTLTAAHLKNYPDQAHLAGTVFTVRLIRAHGTSRLRARVLLTTLLDEKRYRWFDLAKLYVQRWRIELAFRHLKSNLRLEHIRKCALHRIRQLLWAAIMLYNLGGMIRNHLQSPALFPRKAQVRIHCFAFILEQTEPFLMAVLFPRRGRRTDLRHRLRAMRGCCFLYDPWRVRPRICQFPSSIFTRCKSTEHQAELEKAEAIRSDMRLLGIRYGQIAS